MSSKFNSEEVFLKIAFRSSEKIGTLKTIELVGVPGERLRSGEYIVTEKTQHFFDDLMIRKIFRESRRLPSCDFEYLKIWLYDMNESNENRGYKIPQIDGRDLVIHSKTASSLEQIYVLDNELIDREKEEWVKTAEDLFTPLFHKFITPPEPPNILRNHPLTKIIETIGETVDPHLKMKQAIFFNALIIQID
jgi:hypothetical protein